MPIATATRWSVSHKIPQRWLDSGQRNVVAQPFLEPVFDILGQEIQAAEGQASSSTDFQVDLSNSWRDHIREAVYRAPGVESAYIKIEKDNIDVWVIIPERDAKVLSQIADVQWKIIEDMGPTEQMPFSFDLHVIYRDGRPEKELIPQGATAILK